MSEQDEHLNKRLESIEDKLSSVVESIQLLDKNYSLITQQLDTALKNLENFSTNEHVDFADRLLQRDIDDLRKQVNAHQRIIYTIAGTTLLAVLSALLRTVLISAS